jgi:hypothetical protein
MVKTQEDIPSVTCYISVKFSPLTESMDCLSKMYSILTATDSIFSQLIFSFLFHAWTYVHIYFFIQAAPFSNFQGLKF